METASSAVKEKISGFYAVNLSIKQEYNWDSTLMYVCYLVNNFIAE
jgi:hypothetical protein